MSNILGSWECSLASPERKRGDVIEITADHITYKGIEYSLHWIYNEYCIECSFSSTNRWVFVYDENENVLVGIPIFQEKKPYIDKFSRIDGKEMPVMKNETDPRKPIHSLYKEWSNCKVRNTYVSIKPGCFMWGRNHKKEKINKILNPYCIEVVFSRSNNKWIYVLSSQNNCKLYGFTVHKSNERWEKYSPRFPNAIGRRKTVIGLYRICKKKKSGCSRMRDYTMFSSYLPKERFTIREVYMDEWLEDSFCPENEIDIFVVGGGLASKYYSALTEKGVFKLMKFVSKGGSYMGFCAGAFLPLATNCSFRGNHWGFGMIRCDLLSQKSWTRGTKNSCTIEFTKEGKKELLSSVVPPSSIVDMNVEDRIRYANGPILKNLSEKEYEHYRAEYNKEVQDEELKTFLEEIVYLPEPITFAYYMDNVAQGGAKERSPSMIHTPAIIGQDFGKGRVLLSSGHIYLGLSCLYLKSFCDWCNHYPMTPEKENERDLRYLFELFDKDGNGVMDRNELPQALMSLGKDPTNKEIEDLLNRFGIEGNIQFEDFKRILEDYDNNDRELEMAFRVFDRDKNGTLDANELKNALMNFGERMDEQEAKELVQLFDLDGDGTISYREFIELMKAK